jgi:hypothetical protein
MSISSIAFDLRSRIRGLIRVSLAAIGVVGMSACAVPDQTTQPDPQWSALTIRVTTTCNGLLVGDRVAVTVDNADWGYIAVGGSETVNVRPGWHMLHGVASLRSGGGQLEWGPTSKYVPAPSYTYALDC